MKLAKRIGWLVALDIIGAYVAGLLGTTLILFGRWEWGLVEAWTQFALVFLPMQLLVNAYFGLYTNIWNYASLPELANILGASTVGAVFVLLVLGFRTNFQIIAFRTVPLYWLLSTGVFGGIRFSIRFLRERSRGKYQDGDKTLIIGAGDAGFLFTREIAKHPELKLYPIGFLDDDPNKLGMKINDVKVVAHTDKLEYVIEKYEVVKVILAIPSASPQFIRDMVNRCNAVGIKVLTVPGLFELVNGQASISKIRAVQLEDLLNRTEIKVDLSEIGEYVSGKVVLVTGAGGSIGSELCRQISTLMPSKLILLGHGENSIYEIHKELLGSKTHIDLVPIIADVQDKPRLRSVFGALRPQVVFHAAAHKHVPLMENNPVEAIKNNVWGTENVASVASEFGAERFVLISTDKAINPTSVMGATKRAAEMVMQAVSRDSSTKFMAVRFGNVLGSRGSVVPLFREQIAKGGPITITDQEMVRFFMTIQEAVALVLQAGAIGNGGEVFVLDMGKPVRILDMARDLITLSGLRPDVDIEIVTIGIRPGEKLYEELLTAEEGVVSTKHSKIFVARQTRVSLPTYQTMVACLREQTHRGSSSNKEIINIITEATLGSGLTF